MHLVHHFRFGWVEGVIGYGGSRGGVVSVSIPCFFLKPCDKIVQKYNGV